MDTPESPPSAVIALEIRPRPQSSHAAPAADFDFFSSLSPIARLKPLGSTQNVQLFKSSTLAPVSSIFSSPQVNPRKESKSTIRDVKLSHEALNPNCQRKQMGTSSCIELSGSAALASETCSPSEDASNSPSKWLQSTPFGSETLGDANKQDADGITNHTADVEQVKPSSTCSDQENELAKENSNDLVPCSLNNLITHCGTGNSLISVSDLALQAQKQSWKLRGDDIKSSTSFLSVDRENLEDSQSEHFVEPFGSYIQSAADDTYVYCADAAAGVATNHGQEMLPAVIRNQLIQNQLVSYRCIFYTFKVSIDGMALSQHQHDTHRHNLFNDKTGTSNKSMQNISNIHDVNICGNNYLNPVGPAMCQLPMPGIGLHLNTVGLNLSNMPLTINPPLLSEQTSPATVIFGSETTLYGSEVCAHVDDYSSQKTMPNADKSDQQSHKKKRRKLQNNDGESCRHCACKKSRCLKLYCPCFAAKVYCSEFCSCQGCSNNHMHEEEVSCIRKQTESRNPLAFAPTVTRTCGTVSEFGDDSYNTPARHKRGCNCKKSSCLKKYCECFQSGVGCSISCRCEGCKNSFGKREGVLFLTTDAKLEKGGKAKGTHGKEDKLAFDKHHVVSQSGDLPASENPVATPLLEPYRSSFLLPSTCSKLPPSTDGCSYGLHNPRSPMKPDVLLSPFETCTAKMIFGNGFSDIQEVGSSCTTSVKVVSPNKKRVTSLHVGTALSPIGRSSRKLVLKSIPSFPSLIVSPTKQSSSSYGT